MADANTFRTVVGGFHKGDVTEYISRTAQEHQAQVRDLEARITDLEVENSGLRDELAELRELTEQITAPETPAEPPEEPPAEPGDTLETQELLAYRRAEAVERTARDRARALYGAMQDMCRRTSEQNRMSQESARRSLEVIAAQMEALQASLEAVHQELDQDAQALSAMSELVPDPAEGLEEEDV